MQQVYGLYYKKDIEECLLMANATASCCVECVGATEGIVSDEEPLRRYKILKENSRGGINGNRQKKSVFESPFKYDRIG